MNGELFVLSRSGVSFSAKSDSQKFSGSGDLYLSTLRLVFVNTVRFAHAVVQVGARHI